MRTWHFPIPLTPQRFFVAQATKSPRPVRLADSLIWKTWCLSVTKVERGDSDLEQYICDILYSKRTMMFKDWHIQKQTSVWSDASTSSSRLKAVDAQPSGINLFGNFKTRKERKGLSWLANKQCHSLNGCWCIKLVGLFSDFIELFYCSSIKAM